MTLRLAIIGAGLTGTSLLFQLAAQLASHALGGRLDPGRLDVRVFERRRLAGPGFPHNPDLVEPFHITNMCAGEMSVAFDRPGDFGHWVERNAGALARRFPEMRGLLFDPAYHRNGCSHYPRALMGEYLACRFREACDAAGAVGARVSLFTGCEVTDIAPRGGGVRLTARRAGGGAALDIGADRVLLATGHWPRRGGGPGYFPSPWPARRLRDAIPPGAPVGVLGSSLSAIETALTLLSDGRFHRTPAGELVYEPPPSPRRVTLLSRHGRLPGVRGRPARYEPRLLSRQALEELIAAGNGRVTLRSLLDLLERELRAATGGDVDWQAFLRPGEPPLETLARELDEALGRCRDSGQSLFQAIVRQALPLARELFLALSPGERALFDRDYASLFFAHAATQPPANAEKLLALMRSGLLSVTRLGHGYHLDRDPEDGAYRFTCGHSGERLAAFPYLVDARGQERNLRPEASDLFRKLVDRGLVTLTESGQSPGRRQQAGSVLVDPRSHRVMQPDGGGAARPSAWLYAVGAMTRGQILDVSMARGLTRSTATVAGDLISQLAAQPRPPAATP